MHTLLFIIKEEAIITQVKNVEDDVTSEGRASSLLSFETIWK